MLTMKKEPLVIMRGRQHKQVETSGTLEQDMSDLLYLFCINTKICVIEGFRKVCCS
jgi:hypothetical protein